ADAGKVTLFRSEDLWASSVLRPSGKVRPVEVPVRALSEIVQLVGATLLIIDVEGAESELFDRAHLPTVSRIILELHERVMSTAGWVLRIVVCLVLSGVVMGALALASQLGTAPLRNAAQLALPAAGTRSANEMQSWPQPPAPEEKHAISRHPICHIRSRHLQP